MTVILYGNPHKGSGLWKPLRVATGALVSCPKCGTVSPITRGVDELGQVSPRFMCKETDCRFEDFVTLKGWVT